MEHLGTIWSVHVRFSLIPVYFEELTQPEWDSHQHALAAMFFRRLHLCDIPPLLYRVTIGHRYVDRIKHEILQCHPPDLLSPIFFGGLDQPHCAIAEGRCSTLLRPPPRLTREPTKTSFSTSTSADLLAFLVYLWYGGFLKWGYP